MGIEATLDTPLARAVRAVGSQSAYGRLTGQSQGNVHRALMRGLPIRDVDVASVAQATGISKAELRPDLFDGSEPVPAEAPTPTDRYNGAQA